MGLPDGARSRALLLGTASSSDIGQVPAVKNNLEALHNSLMRHTGLPDGHCQEVLDARGLREVGEAVRTATMDADDLLLVYYSGHGLVGSDGKLQLALPQTSDDLLPWSAIPFDFLHAAIADARAATKVLILDCCFSGQAIETMASDESQAMGQLTVKGTYTLTSSPSNSPSYAFEDRKFTAFTESLLKVLDEGRPDVGEYLTLDIVFGALQAIAFEQGLPQPQNLNSNSASKLVLARNLHPRAVPPVDGPIVTPRDLLDVRFATVRGRLGYDEGEVDLFLDKVAEALKNRSGKPGLRSRDVRNVRFKTTNEEEGYHIGEVDDFLARVESEFERREGP